DSALEPAKRLALDAGPGRQPVVSEHATIPAASSRRLGRGFSTHYGRSWQNDQGGLSSQTCQHGRCWRGGFLLQERASEMVSPGTFLFTLLHGRFLVGGRRFLAKTVEMARGYSLCIDILTFENLLNHGHGTIASRREQPLECRHADCAWFL